MKKYRRILTGVFLLYLLLAVSLALVLRDNTEHATYKVEINQIMHSLSAGNPSDKLDLSSYEYITSIEYLPEASIADRQKEQDFFTKSKQQKSTIQPLYQGEVRKGYVKFYYKDSESINNRQTAFAEGILFLLFASVFGILLYLYIYMIRPFNKIDELPYQLAKGHYDINIDEQKSRFFGHYQWGMSQLRDTLKVTKKRELELEKEKKLLLLSLSHDMKTPLSTIQLYAKAIEDGVYESKDDIEKGAIGIQKKATEIENYIQDIMKNSRDDVVDITVKKGEFYLNDVMNHIKQIYGEKCKLLQIAFTIEPYENCLLPGDKDRLLEVFENLFENAFKYGDGKKITVSFSREDYCQLIRVKNTGNVVSPQEFHHLFDSFYRASNSKGKQGNGLGLSICRQIIRKMDGEIFAEREEDGMAFVIVLRM